MAKEIVSDYATPLVTAAVALGFGIIMLTPLVASDIPTVVGPSRRHAVMYLFAGIASGTAIISLFFSLQHADVLVVSPIVSISPLITLILARVFLHRVERITMPLVFGTLLIVGGTALVVIGGNI